MTRDPDKYDCKWEEQLGTGEGVGADREKEAGKEENSAVSTEAPVFKQKRALLTCSKLANKNN